MGAPDDEPACIERSRAGDHAAFASLIALHQRMIYSLAYRMTGSAADADDLTQETFVRCYDRLGSYRGASKFSSWLYRIALNTCLNWRKRELRRQRFHEEWSVATEGSIRESDESGPVEDVQEALLRLPAKQRAAIILTVYDELSHGDAARLLDCSEATVSWRVFAARRKLKRWLSTKGANHGRH